MMMVVPARQEARCNLKNGIEIEAANIEDFSEWRLSEMHGLNGGTRIHLIQAF